MERPFYYFKGKLPGLVKKVSRSCMDLKIIHNVGRSPLPATEEVIRFIDLLKQIMFPGHFGYRHLNKENLPSYVSTISDEIYDVLSREIFLSECHQCRQCRQRTDKYLHCEQLAEKKVLTFFERLPQIRKMLALDVQAAYDGDPAARSFDEIIFSYPGVFTVMVYRVAHELFELEVPLLPRIMTEHAHSVTGIDIHPGATIGKSFFIDHGTGVVVGETTHIGDNVKLYQGVTLGAKSFKKDQRGRIIKGGKRHPTLEDNVTIYANATVLGGDVVIGKGAEVGGNVWVTASVPPGTVVDMASPKLRMKNSKHVPVKAPKRTRKKKK